MIKLLVYITTIYFAGLEGLQVADKGLFQYMLDPYNWIDVSSAVINLLLMVKHEWWADSWYGFKAQQDLAAIAVAFVWYQAFYFMRLFDSTAFFINLLK